MFNEATIIFVRHYVIVEQPICLYQGIWPTLDD